jgi:Fic family protein
MAPRTPAKKKTAAPPPEPPKPLGLEQRTAELEFRLRRAGRPFQERYRIDLDMSWIRHDSGIEGVPYTLDELRGAIEGPPPLPDEGIPHPSLGEIRRHREALAYVRKSAVDQIPITLDVVKRIYCILHPEEGDAKSVKYRRDVPQHRLYFHEYTPPEKIPAKMRGIFEWFHDPQTWKARSALRIACRAHYDILRVFPFTSDSGKVARLFMNLVLLKHGYPPAIIDTRERQRYYEALKTANTFMTVLVQDAVESLLSSVEKQLDQLEGRTRAVLR